LRVKLTEFVGRHLGIILLLFATFFVYLLTFWGGFIADATDASHAIAAREILQRNDWITLHINGIRYLEKAPLLYWITAISYQIFGFNEFAVRIPTVVTIVLLGITIYVFGCWAYSKRVGLYGSIITVSCVGMFLFTRLMIPEALLTLWFVLGHFCFLFAFFGEGKRKLFYYGFYLAMALAILSKGFIGIIFCICPAFLFIVITKQWRRWREFRIFSGPMLFLIIALPWHLLAGLKNDNFFWFYIVNEHFLRFFNLRPQRDYNRLPILEYWLLHFLWLFPWSLGFPLLFKERYLPKNVEDVEGNVNLYLLLWAGTIILFFSLSSNQEYYTFPAYPALALLLANAWVKAETERRVFLLWLNRILAGIGLVFATILLVLLWSSRNIPTTGDISNFLNLVAADSEDYTRFMGRFADLTGHAIAELREPAIIAALTIGFGFLVALWLRRQRKHFQTVLVMLLSMWLLFICAKTAHLRFEPVLSSRTLATIIGEHWEANAKIVINGNHEIASSIGFYTDRQLFLLNGRKFNLEFGSRYPDAPPVFLTNETLNSLWVKNNRIFLVTENIKRDELLKSINYPTITVAKYGAKTLLTNKPL
jgi:4-amino-4-deoxy-L-arabinose transferase-like glycosyltransferase